MTFWFSPSWDPVVPLGPSGWVGSKSCIKKWPVDVGPNRPVISITQRACQKANSSILRCSRLASGMTYFPLIICAAVLLINLTHSHGAPTEHPGDLEFQWNLARASKVVAKRLVSQLLFGISRILGTNALAAQKSPGCTWNIKLIEVVGKVLQLTSKLHQPCSHYKNHLIVMESLFSIMCPLVNFAITNSDNLAA